MMYQEVISGIVRGVAGQLIHVEVEIRNGLPYFTMVGCLSKEAAEAKERVASALRSIGHPLPSMKLTVNLSPANIKKKGTAFDFPIAVAFLEVLGVIPGSELDKICILGELALNGKIHGAGCCLPIILEARKRGIHRFFLAAEDQNSLEDMDGIQIIPMEHLSDVLDYFHGTMKNRTGLRKEWVPEEESEDFSDIRGQQHLKRAVEAAVTGRHHLLLVGSPGSGKTMAVKRIPTILPPLTDSQRLEVQSIYDAAGISRNIADWRCPVRMPHSSIPKGALIGGGQEPKAGEITLAHHGILVMDELMEFRQECLEALRQPLEEKRIQVNRLGWNYVFPADFQMIGTMNPCPCGFALEDGRCRCSQLKKRQYLRKLSGPLLDRFDMVLTVKEEKEPARPPETSKEIRSRVINNIQLEKERLAGTGCSFFSELKAEDVMRLCRPSAEVRKLLETAADMKKISRRGIHKILKLSMTLSLMDGEDNICPVHVLEAMTFRNTGFVEEVAGDGR